MTSISFTKIENAIFSRLRVHEALKNHLVNHSGEAQSPADLDKLKRDVIAEDYVIDELLTVHNLIFKEEGLFYDKGRSYKFLPIKNQVRPKREEYAS